MAKCNSLFQEQQEREAAEAYAQHIKDNDPADVLSENDFYEYWLDKHYPKAV